MDNSRLSYHEMSFFLPLMQEALADNRQILDAVLAKVRGAGWYTDGGAIADVVTGKVDDLVREVEETSEADRTIGKLFRKIGSWRRWGESIARLAAPDDREVRLQAVGYGLGSPTTLKRMKSFLVEVKGRLVVHSSDLQELGATPARLAFPGTALDKLQEGSGTLARESAEDAVVRSELRKAYTAAADYARAVNLAIGATQAAADLDGDDSLAGAADALELAVEAALAQARVKARRAAKTRPIPMLTNVAAGSVPLRPVIYAGDDRDGAGEPPWHAAAHDADPSDPSGSDPDGGPVDG